ncbi:L-arabinolactonase [compost metagenome]
MAFFRLADGALRTLHEPSAGPRQPVGGFWRLHADLRLEHLPLPPVAIANSLAFSPDGATLYYCDSPSRQIW